MRECGQPCLQLHHCSAIYARAALLLQRREINAAGILRVWVVYGLVDTADELLLCGDDALAHRAVRLPLRFELAPDALGDAPLAKDVQATESLRRPFSAESCQTHRAIGNRRRR
uniref:Uncharacterized protein n=1 Tax=Haptolina ericina TaxID=156174 RepID=A0A7S3ACA0_9EUKA